jgi:hypothetical protein
VPSATVSRRINFVSWTAINESRLILVHVTPDEGEMAREPRRPLFFDDRDFMRRFRMRVAVASAVAAIL